MYKCCNCDINIESPKWRTEMLDDAVLDSEFSWPVCPYCGEEVTEVFECPQCGEMESENDGEWCERCKDDLDNRLYYFLRDMTEEEIKMIDEEIAQNGLLEYANERRIV